MAAYCASKQALAGWLASVATEWRKDGVRIIDARPGHTETGLASRALFGIAPAFPLGLSPHRVAQVLVGGILGEAKLLASTDF
jgi:cyclic-di-GMP-binding biofilm dispersal mediator protein